MGRPIRLTALIVATCVLCLVLAGCDSSPAVVVATAVPIDNNFRTYRHPTGVFSLRLPPDWIVRDVSQGGAIRVEFSPPANNGLPLTLYVANMGTTLSTSALLDAIARYQRLINGDPAVYNEISRTAQGDGSWRLVGIRQTPIGPRTLNTFVQADGTFFTAAEADLTNLNTDQIQTLRAIINTLRVDSTAVIAPSDLQGSTNASADTGGVISFSSLFAWTTPQGEYVINGLVNNQSGGPLEAIRVTATLYDAQDTTLGDQQSVVPVEILPDKGSAPFSVRFRTGKPSQTARYELSAAARNADIAPQNYMGGDQFIVGNDLAKYNASGYLVVGGDIVNGTATAAYFVKAIVTVFDADSRVVAMDTVFLNQKRLLPGEVGRFEATFPELGGNAIRYTISVEAKTNPGE